MRRNPHFVKRLLLAAVAALGVSGLAAGASAGAASRVVATIAPVHSLAAGVMAGVDTPYLLLPGGASPHSYALRPSDTRALAEADLIFWVGEELESFLSRRLHEDTETGRAISLLRAPGIEILRLRDGYGWAQHHEHEEHEKHGHEAGKAHDAAGNGDHDHDHGEVDAHIWLSPENAVAVTSVMAEALAKRDPANAARYRSNAERQIAALRALRDELAQRLAPVRDRPYVVFHDAYQYFERSFRLQARGAVTLSPERRPGARRLSDLRQALLRGEATCIFVEPQFEPKLVRSLVDGTKVRVATLDPLGSGLEPGPMAYAALLRGLTDSVAECLAVATN